MATITPTNIKASFFVDAESGEVMRSAPPSNTGRINTLEAERLIIEQMDMDYAREWLEIERRNGHARYASKDSEDNRLMRALMKILEGERGVDPKVALGECSFSSILEELRAVQKKPGVFARLAAWAKGVVGRWL